MPVVDLGKVVGDPGASMRFRGDWNNESEYFNNASYIDAVTHNGSLWICKTTNTNQTPAEGTYWGLGAQGMAEENMVFSAYSAFPSVGDENKLYIDNTVNPALMYIWDGSAYVPAGGGGEVAAEDVTYDNASSSLTAQTVQEAIDENAEAISALNSSYGTNENGSYLRMPDGTQICWLNTTVTDQAINTLYTNGVYQGIRNWTFPIPFIDSPSVSCGCFRYGTGASWGAINASTPTEAGLRAYDFVSREAGQNCLIQAIAIGRWKS